MAITWHTPISKTYTYPNRARLGHEFTQSPATVGASTTSVAVTLKVYLQTTDAVSDSSTTLNWSGSFGSGTASPTVNTTYLGGGQWSSSQNIVLLRTLTRTVTPSTVSKITSQFSANMSGLSRIPGTMYASGSTTTGTRPVSAPAAPTGAKVTRVSDSQHTVSWTPTNPTSTTAPYQSQVLQRWDSATNAYATIATLSGTASSYVDRSTAANKRYRWRLYAKNSGGTSSYAVTDYIYTAPAAPTSATARRVGADVAVSWSPASVPGISPQFEIVRQASGGAWDYAGAVTVPAGTTTWTDKAPDSTKTWKYAVRAVLSNNTNKLFSGYVQTGTVQLLTPPAAPTNLTPTIVEAGTPVTLTWSHNPLDSSDQSAYELRWRRTGTSTWTSVPKQTSSRSSHDLAPLDAGPTVEWQVRTWGDHTDPSPWSSLALLRVAERPALTLVSPTEGTLTSSSVFVDWETFDPEGEGQAAYRVTIYDSTGEQVWVGGGLIATSTTPPVRLQDDTDYRIVVEARAYSGLWADPVEAVISVNYAAPPAAIGSLAWDPGSGAMVITWTTPEPGDGEVPATSVQVWRATTGEDWTLVADGLPVDSTITDPTPPIGVPVHYKVVTVSDLPSTMEAVPLTEVPDSRGTIYLSGGPGWANMLRIPTGGATITPQFGVHADLVDMVGLTAPLEVSTEQTTQSIGVDVRIWPVVAGGVTYQELREFIRDNRAPVLWRDPLGNHLMASLTQVQVKARGPQRHASFTVTEIANTQE